MKKLVRSILVIMVMMSVVLNGSISGASVNTVGNGSDISVLEATDDGMKLKEAYEREKGKNIDDSIQEDSMANEEESIEQYDRLQEVVYNADTSKYKSYYGGAYIDDEGDLVVQTSKKNGKIIENIKEATESKDVSVNLVEYSYTKLQKVYDQISDEMEKREKDIVGNIVSANISQEENRVIVSMKDFGKDKIEEFKKCVSDEECIKFEQAGESSVSGSMYLGKKIKISGAGDYSIGCRAYAYKDGKIKYGFITAGHNTMVNDTVSYYLSDSSTVKIGKIIAKKCSGSVDCAFVEVTNGNYKASNRVKSASGTALKTYMAASYVEGETIYKSGYKGGTKKGKILSTSCTVTYGDVGVTLKKLYKANYQTKMGDSGGVVYHNSERNFSGIQSGVQDNSLKNGYYHISFYVAQDYVLSDWGGLKNIFLY